MHLSIIINLKIHQSKYCRYNFKIKISYTYVCISRSQITIKIQITPGSNTGHAYWANKRVQQYL